jgi:hypothetical protein
MSMDSKESKALNGFTDLLLMEEALKYAVERLEAMNDPRAVDLLAGMRNELRLTTKVIRDVKKRLGLT